MRDYGLTNKSVLLMCDSSSAICLAQNTIFYGRVKHIKVRHQLLRDHVEKGDIEMKYIDTERQLADIFTKHLDATCFASLRWELGVCHPYGMVCGGSCVLPCIYSILSSSYCISFISTYLPITSLIMLTCIWLTMLVTVLG
jgi:hypothetical protein